MYEQLADALNRLPNGYPRTKSGVELRILQKIFSPEEAALACQLTGEMENLETITARVHGEKTEVRSSLFAMIKRGLVWFEKRDGTAFFRLAPFIVGIYEAQVELLDHDLAHLVEQYLFEGGAAGIMKPQPALHRVVPAPSALKREQILPYDDVRAVLLKATAFNARECICRKEQDYIGRRCDFPLKLCLSFSNSTTPGDLTQDDALALLDRAEQLGLVHTVNNVIEGLGYVCNCCSCCCGILRGITDFGFENSVAYANYYAKIDPIDCTGCGICIDRCQVHAITEGEGFSVVEWVKCIGCGLCVTGCPNDAAHLVRKPESEIIHPPATYAEWEKQRLANRAAGIKRQLG